MNRESSLSFFEFSVLPLFRHKLFRWLYRCARVARVISGRLLSSYLKGTRMDQAIVCQINIWEVIQPD